MPFSPWESILNTLPLGLSITMQSLGPVPDWLCFWLSASVHVTSHALAEGRTERVEIARGRTVDHFILLRLERIARGCGLGGKWAITNGNEDQSVNWASPFLMISPPRAS